MPNPDFESGFRTGLKTGATSMSPRYKALKSEAVWVTLPLRAVQLF